MCIVLCHLFFCYPFFSPKITKKKIMKIKWNTDLFCSQSGLSSVNCMIRVSRVTSSCICFRAVSMPKAISVAPNAVVMLWRSLSPIIAWCRWFDVASFAPPVVSSATAQSTNGSYTNASNSVNNVSRPFFSVFRTCSHASRNVPYIKKKENMEKKLNFVTFGFKAQAG